MSQETVTGIVTGLITIGIVAGVLLCGFLWFLWWVFSHLSISWV